MVKYLYHNQLLWIALRFKGAVSNISRLFNRQKKMFTHKSTLMCKYVFQEIDVFSQI